jgi:hypothetical protein
MERLDMKKILTGAVAALTACGALAVAAPAAAQSHGRGGGHWSGGHSGSHGGQWSGGRSDGWGGHHGSWAGSRGGYGYRDHYRGGSWGGGALAAGVLGLAAGAALSGAYAPYGDGYGYYDYGPYCRTVVQWNPYYGGYERVRVCD